MLPYLEPKFLRSQDQEAKIFLVESFMYIYMDEYIYIHIYVYTLVFKYFNLNIFYHILPLSQIYPVPLLLLTHPILSAFSKKKKKTKNPIQQNTQNLEKYITQKERN